MSEYTDELRQSLLYYAKLAQERDDEIDRLRERVAELEAAIRAVQAEHVQDEWVCRSFCRICSRKYGLWPCLTRVDLDAVLPPEEQG
ncbi:MAG: hypothetical protein M0027_16440 [Candidatus Dormibacteraeota bacterium]|nr:hypothetical protein [Candidatus Dormibacteraeota bacterium]